MILNSKKYYTAPTVSSIKLDRSIVLLTPTGNPPGMAAPAEPERPSYPSSSTPPSTNSTPFGGGKPDFSDM